MTLQVYVIGITNSIQISEVQGMSSPPQLENQNYFLAADFQALDSIVSSIVSQTCVDTGGTASTSHFFTEFCTVTLETG